MVSESITEKDVIIKLFIEQVKNGYIRKEYVQKMGAWNIVEQKNGRYILKEEFRKKISVAVTGGVFDILHPGHAFLLEKAKNIADVLVVIVARDETVKRMKRVPIIPEAQRVEMVSYLKPVDVAILGRSSDNFIETIKDIKPEYIVLGFNQKFDEKKLKEELMKQGLNAKIVRIKEKKECPLDSTRKIINRIVEMCKKGIIW